MYKGNLVQVLEINSSLLENEEFITNLKFFVIQVKKKHKVTIDKKLYWEMINMEIRDFCIRFLKRSQKQKVERNRPTS